MRTALFDESNQVRFGVWVFLASEIMFFGPVFLGYAIARYALSSGFDEAASSTNLVIGAFNTAILLTSSAAVAMAVVLSREHEDQKVKRSLEVTIGMGALFMILKAVEYWQDWQEGLIPGDQFFLASSSDQRAAELFYSLYFFSTLLHSVHLLIGLGLLTGCRIQYAGTARNLRRLEGYALYWHFVDVIWIFLFPLLYLVGRAA